MSHSSVHGVAFHRPWCLIPRFHCQTWILYILWWNCKTTNRITITGFVYHLKSQKWHQIIIHKSKICVTRNVLTSRKMFIDQIRADPYISGINQPISKKISASRTELFKGLHVTWNFWKTLYFLSYDSLKLKIFDRKRTKFYAFSFSKEFFYQKTTLNLDETYTTKKYRQFPILLYKIYKIWRALEWRNYAPKIFGHSASVSFRAQCLISRSRVYPFCLSILHNKQVCKILELYSHY